MKKIEASPAMPAFGGWEWQSLETSLPILVFLILHVTRPFHIGLYHDDWSLFNVGLFTSHEKFCEYFVYGFEDRPIYGFILYVINKVSNGDPAILAVISSALVAITALSLYQLLIRVTELLGSVDKMAASLGVGMWIAIPWGFGYSLWPTGAATLPAVIFFLWSSAFAVDFIVKRNICKLFLSLILLVLSYLTYETTYLAFLPLLLIVAGFKIDDKASLRRTLKLLIFNFIILALAVFKTSMHTPKNISINLRLLLGNFIYALPKAVLISFGFLWPIYLILIIALVVLSAENLLKMDCKSKIKFGLGLSACLLGLVISTIPYSFAGYIISGTGVFSRTMICASIWLTLLFTLAVILCRSSIPRKKDKYASLLAVSIVLTMIIASGIQLYGWSLSWTRQQQILKSFPTNFVRNMPEESVLVLDEPMYSYGIEVFAAPWDISCAVYSLPDMRNQARNAKKIEIVPLYTDIPMHWDGFSTLKVRPSTSLVAKRVWIYNPSVNVLKEVSGEGEIRSSN